MATVFIFVLSFISVFLTPATSQLDIVSVRTIEDGRPFTITCNAQRVITTQANFSTISSLEIDIWNSGADKYKMVAQYFTYGPPGTQKEKQVPPDGRKWQFSFSGSNTDTQGVNNQASMKIDVLMPAGTCEDAGMYKCIMVYYSAGALVTDSSEQNVTSTATTTEPLVVLNPIYGAPTGISNTSNYDVGENVTVTCRFEGPEALGIKWKRERRPAIGIDVQYDDYPIANDITTDTPTKVPTTSATCPSYTHRSVLELTISSEDKDRQYQCVVVLGEEVRASSAVFIQLNEGTPAPDRAAGANSKPGGDDVGLIVGVVVGCVVAIIIIIIIIVCCVIAKRNKKNAHNTDRPDGGHNQPAPPPVLYSRPNKGINNNNSSRDSKVPAGRVNQGLDNSFDSKGSGHKAPPVYTITSQKQSYQGRPNQAYDTEDKSTSRQPQESDPRYYNYETSPPARRYSTDDNTDARRDYYEAENFGTGV